MRGLLFKAIAETWVMTAVLGASLFLVKLFLTIIVPQFSGDELSGFLAQVPFIRSMISAMMGVEVEGSFTTQMLQAIMWIQPMVLAIPWTHELVFCTRVPVSEVDRGTVDVLLSWPVSRLEIYAAESIVWIGSGMTLIAFAVLGHVVGARWMVPEDRASAGTIGFIVVNFLALYIAVGGATYLMSALGERRIRAIGVVMGIVMASFLLNFLAQFWPAAREIVFLSLLDHYRPAHILQSGKLPVGDVALLLAIGLLAWIAGAVVFVRRDIRTV